MNDIAEVLAQSQAGKMTFPDVVARLLAQGVESYQVDLAAGTETVYSKDGTVQTEKMTVPRAPIATEFSESALVSAIRSAQADTIRYPEFIQRSTGAGVIGYWAFLTGRKVMYFGRKGEVHTENFPPTN